MANKRIEYIDIYRAIGILCMVAGHVNFGPIFGIFIHAFHMPMFYIASGYFFRSNIKFKDYIKKKVKTLIVPYIIFGFVFYVIQLLMNSNGWYLTELKNLLFYPNEGVAIAGALWFLISLFIVDIFMYFIEKIKNKYIKLGMVIILSLIGNLSNIIIPFKLPFAISSAFVGVGLFYIGNLTQKYKDNKIVNKCMNLNYFELLVVIIFELVLIFINGEVNMRTGIYSIIPLFWINAVISSAVIINISKIILKLKKIRKILINIGRDSIAYVCMNQFVILIIVKITNLFNLINIEIIEKLVDKLLILIFTISTIYIVNWLINKTKFKFILGK